MSLPTIAKTWIQANTTGTPGVRIPYVSLIDLTQNYLYGQKTMMLAEGQTVVWSASGGTGPTNSADHTDRWSSAAAVTPRATVDAASQAWVVILDLNGGQTLITFQGATDDIARVSYSPGALFTLANTTNQRPTAADEMITTAAQTLVGSTTSGDRIWHGWVSSDGKGYRFGIMRAGVFVGQVYGTEQFTSGVIAPATVAPAVWTFCYSAGSNMSAANITGAYATTKGGLVTSVVSSIKYQCQTGICTETTIGGINAPSTYTYQPELQGAGFTPYPAALHTTNQTGSRGRLGNLIDWWIVGPSGVVDGDGFGNSYQFFQVGGAIWPNPSNTAPTIS